MYGTTINYLGGEGVLIGANVTKVCDLEKKKEIETKIKRATCCRKRSEPVWCTFVDESRDE